MVLDNASKIIWWKAANKLKPSSFLTIKNLHKLSYKSKGLTKKLLIKSSSISDSTITEGLDSLIK